MRKREIEIEGIKYVLERMKFGKDLDVTEGAIDIEIVGDKPVPKMNIKKLQFSTLLSSLKSWEFRGYDENDEFKKEGEILPITEENIKELPSSHGLTLQKNAMELNGLADIEVKNL